jgi:hypothetical protein
MECYKCFPGLSFFYLIIFLFIFAYNVWVISPPFPHPLPYLPPPRPLSLPSIPSLPGRNYFALISNFVEERVEALVLVFYRASLSLKHFKKSTESIKNSRLSYFVRYGAIIKI